MLKETTVVCLRDLFISLCIKKPARRPVGLFAREKRIFLIQKNRASRSPSLTPSLTRSLTRIVATQRFRTQTLIGIHDIARYIRPLIKIFQKWKGIAFILKYTTFIQMSQVLKVTVCDCFWGQK